MTRESRMLLIIAVFSIGGISALSYMANRYSSVLREQPGTAESAATSGAVSAPAPQKRFERAATARVLGSVDQFIGVRSRMHAEIDRRGGTMSGREEFVDLRATALSDSGMTLSDYGRIRESLRTWRSGQMDERDVMAAAFEQRKAALERLDLGELEDLDS